MPPNFKNLDDLASTFWILFSSFYSSTNLSISAILSLLNSSLLLPPKSKSSSAYFLSALDLFLRIRFLTGVPSKFSSESILSYGNSSFYPVFWISTSSLDGFKFSFCYSKSYNWVLRWSIEALPSAIGLDLCVFRFLLGEVLSFFFLSLKKFSIWNMWEFNNIISIIF